MIHTGLANRAAWSRYALRPRAAVGRNVTRVDLSTTVLGRRVALPLLLGAAGGHGIAHTLGEIAVARAAAAAGQSSNPHLILMTLTVLTYLKVILT